MRRFSFALLVALVLSAAPLAAAVKVAQLPACSKRYYGVIASVVDGASSSDCATGLSTYTVACLCTQTNAWSSLGGGAGADGCSVLNGSGAPAGGTGKNCDFYINTAASTIYGPKSGGAWGSPTSLVGPAGADGADGATGATQGSVDFGGYDPDTLPTVVAGSSDEFTGSVSGSWRWGGQGSATDTYSYGGALLYDPKQATNNMRIRWLDAPSATDFTVTAKLIMLGRNDGADSAQYPNYVKAGISVLVTGTEGTPTLIHHLMLLANSYVGISHNSATDNAAGGWATVAITNQFFNTTGASDFRRPVWLQFRYTASTKNLAGWFSTNGVDFFALGATATLSAHPISVGRFISSGSGNVVNNTARYFYFRVRTDANRNESGQ